MLNPSLRVGILNASPVTCHYLEAPELPEPSDSNVPHVHAETPLQLPYGAFSALSEMMHGNLTAVETLILTVLGHHSNWDSGETWKTNLRKLSKLTFR